MIHTFSKDVLLFGRILGIIPDRPFPKRPLPKTVVSRPIVEFGGMGGFFLLVDLRSFWEAAFLGTAFLALSYLTRILRQLTTVDLLMDLAG